MQYIPSLKVSGFSPVNNTVTVKYRCNYIVKVLWFEILIHSIPYPTCTLHDNYNRYAVSSGP